MFNDKMLDLIKLYEKDNELIENCISIVESVYNSLPDVYFEQTPIRENFEYHSIGHFKTVALYAVYFAIKTNNNPINAAFAGLFHDIGRNNDRGEAIGHDKKSIEILRFIKKDFFLYMSDFDLEEICNSILNHDSTDYRAYDNLSGCLRDADRLYLVRTQKKYPMIKKINTTIGKRLFLLDSLLRFYPESNFDKEKKVLINCHHITKFKNYHNIKKNGIKPSEKNFSHLKNKIYFSLNENSILGRPTENEEHLFFSLPISMRKEIDENIKLDSECFISCYFDIPFDDIEGWDISKKRDSFCTKKPIQYKDIKKILNVGNVISKVNEKTISSFPNLSVDYSISEQDSIKIIYPFYKIFEKVKPEIILEKKIKQSFDFFEHVLKIEKNSIVFFEKIKILNSYEGIGNIINICDKNKDPIFFFGELGFYDITGNFSIGIHDGYNWNNQDFRLIGTSFSKEKEISLALIIRDNEISIFIKPYDRDTQPILIKNEKLKTTQNFIGKDLYFGSANRNYRSALIEIGLIKIYSCPKNIEEELKCVIC